MEREDNQKASEINFTNTDGSVDLKALTTGLLQKFLGKALDYGRMSGMSDRSFTQYQRSLKDDMYVLLSHGIRILEETGHIQPDKSAKE